MSFQLLLNVDSLKKSSTLQATRYRGRRWARFFMRMLYDESSCACTMVEMPREAAV
jgi:hypothetical protein